MKIYIQRSGNQVVGVFLARPNFAVEEVDDQSPEVAAFRAADAPTIPLAVIQSRMEAETVAGLDGWTAYVNYIFGASARRNAFFKIMFIGKPLRQDHAGLILTMNGAGFTADQIARVMAAL